MRIRFVVLGLSMMSVGGAFALGACGDTTTDTPAADAGTDTGPADTGPADTGPADTGIDVATDQCDPSSDFTTKIPDASIADGATTSGICVGCVEANCKKELTDCNTNCVCQGLAGDALDCYLKSNGDVASCAGDFLGVQGPALNIGISLFGCITSSCKAECATSAFEDGGLDDGGDAGDGGTDAN